MEGLQKIRSSLENAEAEMRGLIEVAVAQARYVELARLAEIAELLRSAIQLARASSDVLGSGQVDQHKHNVGTLEQNVKASNSYPANRSQRRNKDIEFPKFETDRNRLIKIGWSKKDRAIYEHRASRDLVEAVSIYLASSTGVFKMEDMLPIELGDGTEVPLYQAYLVLAWLRKMSLIEKQGNDGYSWTVETFDESAFSAAWEATPRRP